MTRDLSSEQSAYQFYQAARVQTEQLEAWCFLRTSIHYRDLAQLDFLEFFPGVYAIPLDDGIPLAHPAKAIAPQRVLGNLIVALPLRQLLALVPRIVTGWASNCLASLFYCLDEAARAAPFCRSKS